MNQSDWLIQIAVPRRQPQWVNAKDFITTMMATITAEHDEEEAKHHDQIMQDINPLGQEF